MVSWISRISAALIALTGFFCMPFYAQADDIFANLLSPPPAAPDNSFEARLGAFAHAVGSNEQGSVDSNMELLFPRLPIPVPAEYGFLVPRPQIGGMINTDGKTSYAYAGVVWTLNITPRFFLEPMFGGAVHNGELDTPDPTRNSLGCVQLFHTGLSTGFRLSDHWTILGTWDHISDARLCDRNQGINDYGIKLGYRFD
jgi:lipid A 3-O-deacylase